MPPASALRERVPNEPYHEPVPPVDLGRTNEVAAPHWFHAGGQELDGRQTFLAFVLLPSNPEGLE